MHMLHKKTSQTIFSRTSFELFFKTMFPESNPKPTSLPTY